MDKAISVQVNNDQPEIPKIIKLLFIVTIIIIFIIAIRFCLNLLPSKSSKQNVNQPVASTPTPDIYNYNAKKANTLLTQYVKDALKPELLPENIEVKQGIGLPKQLQQLSGVSNRFGSSFVIKKSVVSVNFDYKKSTDVADIYNISINPENANQASPTAFLTNSLLKSYFANPPTVSGCQQDLSRKAIFCESFQISDKGKVGYGIVQISGITNAFSCFIPKESGRYQRAKSCFTP